MIVSEALKLYPATSMGNWEASKATLAGLVLGRGARVPLFNDGKLPPKEPQLSKDHFYGIKFRGSSSTGASLLLP